jgi:MFS family permease
VLLDPAIIDPEKGWRLAFLTGAGLGLIVFVMRFWILESPRWLMIHGQPERARRIVAEIEKSVAPAARGSQLPRIKLTMRTHTPIWRSNHHAVPDVSHPFDGRPVSDGGTGIFLQRHFLHLCFGFDRFLRYPCGKCRLVHSALRGWEFSRTIIARSLFDTLGRRSMIAFTYSVSGILLAVSGYLFSIGLLSANPDDRLDGDLLSLRRLRPARRISR